MITRKTLKLFGCHEAAVEQFAREAGLPIEEKSAPLKNGDWVRVRYAGEDTRSRSSGDALRNGWVGQVIRANAVLAEVNFFGRPLPVGFSPYWSQEVYLDSLEILT